MYKIILMLYVTRERLRRPYITGFFNLFFYLFWNWGVKMQKEEQEKMREKIETYIKHRTEFINDILQRESRLHQRNSTYKKPIREAKELSRKTRNNLERLTDVLCGNTKFESVNIRKLLLAFDRYKILIDFYIIADGLKIDNKKRKKPENKNKDIRFMDFQGNYFFTLSIDKFIELRGSTRASISRNINLFVFLGLIEKRNPYTIEVASIINQEQNRQDKINMIDIAVKNKEFELNDRKNDFNFLTIYAIPGLTNRIFKDAEIKADRLFQVNFSISSFTSIFLTKYFGIEEASKVYFHKNLIGFTEYSNFLQNKIKDAIIQEISNFGFTTKDTIYKRVLPFCSAKEFEIIERYGRPRTSRRNTFEIEYHRILGELLQENTYIKASSTPTNKMKETFNLKDGKHILYDSRKLEK